MCVGPTKMINRKDDYLLSRFIRFCLRRRWKTIIIASIVILIVYLSGILVHLFEKSYETSFEYPINRPDFPEFISRIVDGREREDDKVTPLNSYDYPFIIKNEDKCHTNKIHGNDSNTISSPRLILMVKSALTHVQNRNAIRMTWGFEGRFSLKRIFVLGSCPPSSSSSSSCQSLIDEENRLHKDLIQADFHDSYYNNTLKTMMGLKWLVTHCSEAEFALFVDDDYYVSVYNLLNFLNNSLAKQSKLFLGHVFSDSSPMRHPSSKWYVSLRDYPFDRFPPYVTAGAYVLSNRAFRELAVASLYTQFFIFDDIYLGILAKKISLSPLHNNKFLFWPQEYDADQFKDAIASHGFSDPEYLIRVWMEQKDRGNA